MAGDGGPALVERMDVFTLAVSLRQMLYCMYLVVVKSGRRGCQVRW